MLTTNTSATIKARHADKNDTRPAGERVEAQRDGQRYEHRSRQKEPRPRIRRHWTAHNLRSGVDELMDARGGHKIDDATVAGCERTEEIRHSEQQNEPIQCCPFQQRRPAALALRQQKQPHRALRTLPPAAIRWHGDRDREYRTKRRKQLPLLSAGRAQRRRRPRARPRRPT